MLLYFSNEILEKCLLTQYPLLPAFALKPFVAENTFFSISVCYANHHYAKNNAISEDNGFDACVLRKCACSKYTK